jgi:hypothetical protein
VSEITADELSCNRDFGDAIIIYSAHVFLIAEPVSSLLRTDLGRYFIQPTSDPIQTTGGERGQTLVRSFSTWKYLDIMPN